MTDMDDWRFRVGILCGLNDDLEVEAKGDGDVTEDKVDDERLAEVAREGDHMRSRLDAIFINVSSWLDWLNSKELLLLSSDTIPSETMSALVPLSSG